MGIRDATVYGELGAVCRALARKHGIQMEVVRKAENPLQITLFVGIGTRRFLQSARSRWRSAPKLMNLTFRSAFV
jgi:hypothetical protein